MTRRSSITAFLLAVVLIAAGAILLRPSSGPGPTWRAEYERRDAGVPRTSGAMAAMKWLAEQRAYPGDAYPHRGWTDAWAHETARLRPPAEKTAPWTPIGPRNIGGRTLAVAFNPQNPSTIWAGSASGGLWRSFTGGVGEQAWHRVPTGFPVLGVSTVAVAPGDSNLMYIGTGEVYAYDDTQGGLADRLTRGSFGIGILKSTDGGATWSKSLDWSYDQGRGVWAVRFAPDDTDVVWAATTEGVYKSTDAGATWLLVLDVVMANDLLVHAGNPDIVVVACGNLLSPGRGFYRTDDGGQTWTQLVDAQVIPTNFYGKAQIAGAPGDPDVMMIGVGNGGLGSSAHWTIRSEDAGLSWFTITYFDYSRWQGWFSHDLAIHPTDSWRVMMIGLDIHRLEGPGGSMSTLTDWRRSYFGQVPVGGPEGPVDYSHADHHDIAWHPTDPDVIYVATDGGLFRTTDGGTTWAGCNGGYQTTQFYAGFASSPTDPHHALGGMQDNYSAIYDGTDAWIRVVGGDGAWAAIDAVDEDVLYASAQNLYLFRSPNRGQNWLEITPDPMIGQPGFIAPFALAGAEAPQTIYAGTTYLIRSLDSGGSWEARSGLGGDPALAIAVSPVNGDHLAVTTAPVDGPARVFCSFDGADSVLDVTGGLPDRYPVGLAFCSQDPYTCYVTYSGFGTGHVYRTRDGGLTWTDLTGDLPDVPTSSVLVDPLYPEHIYVGTDLGVYASTDDGVTWSDFSEGLPDAVMCMDLSTCDAERLLRVSTYGNGVWERPLLSGGPTSAPGAMSGASLLRLGHPHPNPFNPRTSIPFSLSREARVTAEVFNPRGERVATLMREVRPAGDHVMTWDGTSDTGRPQPTGVYLCRIAADGRSRTVKMHLVR